jgi:hypothetical protein
MNSINARSVSILSSDADRSLAAAEHRSTAVTFDPSTHCYRFHGTRLISVTQAIQAAGLIDTEWYTEAARQRGRAVHLAVHFDAEGDLDESSISPLIRPYLEAARHFKHDTQFLTELTEARVWAIDLGYAGTIDHLGCIGKKQRVLIDWKHATGLRFLTVTEATGYEIMSVGRAQRQLQPEADIGAEYSPTGKHGFGVAYRSVMTLAL